MSEYRRAVQFGGTFFFTVVTNQRKPIFNNEQNIEILRTAFRKEINRRPFLLEAIVVLPDHLHCIWKLPEKDSDFSSRWREIKKYSTRMISKQRNARGEGDVWQRRFWEHQIRDERDWQNHMDYIHFNPVKHGYVDAPAAWKSSSFRKWVRLGVYDSGWGESVPDNIRGLEFE